MSEAFWRTSIELNCFEFSRTNRNTSPASISELRFLFKLKIFEMQNSIRIVTNNIRISHIHKSFVNEDDCLNKIRICFTGSNRKHEALIVYFHQVGLTDYGKSSGRNLSPEHDNKARISPIP